MGKIRWEDKRHIVLLKDSAETNIQKALDVFNIPLRVDKVLKIVEAAGKIEGTDYFVINLDKKENMPIKEKDSCPGCRNEIEHKEGCKSCPKCGWSACDS